MVDQHNMTIMKRRLCRAFSVFNTHYSTTSPWNYFKNEVSRHLSIHLIHFKIMQNEIKIQEDVDIRSSLCLSVRNSLLHIHGDSSYWRTDQNSVHHTALHTPSLSLYDYEYRWREKERKKYSLFTEKKKFCYGGRILYLST